MQPFSINTLPDDDETLYFPAIRLPDGDVYKNETVCDTAEEAKGYAQAVIDFLNGKIEKALSDFGFSEQ